MNCPQCNTENPKSAKFCLACGQVLKRACPECGIPLPAAANFCSQCGARIRPAASPHRDRSPAIPDALQRLVPREYAARLLATRGQVPRERRMVSLLFCDVAGSTTLAETLDPEDWMEVMDSAFDVLIQPITRYEGTLARLMGDAVLAFFGAPLAHEDDPERACRAALEIMAGVQHYAARLEQERGITGFAVRIGIHSGQVVVGEIGSDLRVEYTAMGDAVNVAARLEQAAPPGGILISHDTYRHLRGVFDVLPQPPLAVQGKAQLIRTYLVRRAKPRAFRKPVRSVEGIETRMIGREAELKHLQDAFRTALEDGELQVVTVGGRAGVGKSRLLHEFDIWAETLAPTFYYFRGHASRETQNLPYALIRDLLAFRLQIQDGDAPAAVRTKLEEGVGVALGAGQASQRAAHLIGHLLGFELGDSPHLSELVDDSQQLRDAALGCLADYLRGMAGQHPVLILLEDLHWADDSSLDALNHLTMSLAAEPIMIASAARTVLFERRPHWGEGQPFHTRLGLHALSKWDSRRLVTEILQKVDQVPGAFRDRIVAEAQGNPFFIEERIKMLVEQGVILKDENLWHLETAHLRDLHVPPTLTGLLQARLDRLPPAEKAVLQQASVVGHLFWDQAVVHVHETVEGLAEPTVLDHLAALRDREMIFQRETSAFAGAQEYVFKHALLREVAYQSVLKRQRRAYHGRVADWLLEQVGDRAGEYTGLLADHLELAGRAEEAVAYLIHAADRARGLHAHQEAITAYERALVLLKAQEAHRSAARTLMKLGLAHDAAFDFHHARQAYEEGFAHWQQGADIDPDVPLPRAPHALRLAWTEPTTLDPSRATDSASNAVIEQLFRGLVERTVDMGILPDAAQSWEVLDGGRRYVFHLRQNLFWSDRRPVTAGDFEYSWLRFLAPCGQAEPCYCRGRWLFDVQGARAYHRGRVQREDVGVRAVNDNTLVVDLEGATGHFLHLLAGGLPAIPRHVVEVHGTTWADVDKIVTNGPFRLAAWQPGASMILERDPAYRGHFSGNVQQVELTFLPAAEPLAELEYYARDRLDVLSQHASLLRARTRWPGEYVSAPALGTTYIAFNAERPPFDDARVRRAFILATDRENLAGVVHNGLRFPATGGIVPPGMPGHSPGIGLPYDPARARKLLAGATFPGIRALSYRDEVCQYLQEQWRENLGVEISWQVVDMASFIQQFYANLPHMSKLTYAADYPDPDAFLRIGFPWPAGWRNEVCEGLIEKARRVTDQAQRMELYQQADRLIIDEAVVLPLTYDRGHTMLKPWVKRYPISALQNWFWKDVVLEPH